jgi:two-component system sensor histidine kinase/response regulator
MNKDIILNSRILIIDDNTANVLLLERILHQSGYQHCESLTDSREIISHFRTFQPDLILLDLMMPHVDGFAVMKQLRGWVPDGEFLPILVITADTSGTAKQKALTLGAKDFLTKPIDNVEACLRVYNLLETRWLHREIQAQNKLLHRDNDYLEAIVQSRTRQLTEAQQRLSILDKAKSDFLNLISHELRTPLNGLLGTSELILAQLKADPESDELREMFIHSRQRILAMLDNALLLTQIEVEGEKLATAPTSLGAMLAQAIDKASELARSRLVRLQTPRESIGFILKGSPLLATALQTVLETAVKFAQPREAVVITFEQTGTDATLIIQTQSGTLSRAAIAHFFDLLAISEGSTSAGDLGLGPALADRIISLFGGTVAVRNRQPSGIELHISYPSAISCSAGGQLSAAGSAQ